MRAKIVVPGLLAVGAIGWGAAELVSSGAGKRQPASRDRNPDPYRWPGFFCGYIDTGIERFSAIETIRFCSATWAAG